MPWLSYWLSSIKAGAILRFKFAKRRVTTQTDEIGDLSKARIVSATEELNQIADDVRDAKAAADTSPSTVLPQPLTPPPDVPR
jgi:hypothetical protein